MIRTGFLGAAHDATKNTRRPRALWSNPPGKSAIVAFVAVCLCGFSISVSQGALPAPIRTVAQAGETAPGRNTPFASFLTAAPTVNSHGEAAFRATLTRPEAEGIWAERGAAGLRAVALRGQAAPGIASRSFESFESVRFNNSGQVAFTATLNAAPSIFNNDGLWLAQPNGSIDFIARSGGRVAGSSKNVVQIEPEYVTLNHQGNISFRGRYTESFTHDARVFSYTGPGTTELVVEAFDAVPNEPSPRLFSTVAFDGALIDGAGRTFFKGFIGTSTGGPTSEMGIYRHNGQSFTTLARDLRPVPGMTGVDFNGIYPFDMAINSVGQFAFASSLTGSAVTAQNNVGLFRGNPDGSIELLLRRGDQAPGMPAGIQFAEIHSPEINKHGQLAFLGKIRGPGVTAITDEMVWVQTRTGEFRAVAREGDAAAEAPAQVFFGDRFSQFQVFRQLVINANGQVAFHSLLKGAGLGDTSGNLNADGVWATDVEGSLRSIAIAGQPFQTAEGDSRVHGTIIFAGDTGNDEGLLSGLSDAGHVAFQGYFRNDPAIYVSSKVAVAIPEPTCAALAMLAFGLVFVRKRGRYAV